MAELKATKREQTGTHAVRRLRTAGRIPAVIYGHGEATEPVTLDKHDVVLAIQHGERLLEVDIDGKKQNVLVKEVQYDALGHEMLHVDLARVDLDELVKVNVKIMLRGTPAGAIENGVLQQIAAVVSIECAVRAIPDDVRVSVAHMNVGDQLFMRDLPLPAGAKLLSDPNAMVASVRVIAEEEVAPVAEAGPSEPEVIGEKKDEEAEEGAEPEAAKKPEKKEKAKE